MSRMCVDYSCGTLRIIQQQQHHHHPSQNASLKLLCFFTFVLLVLSFICESAYYFIFLSSNAHTQRNIDF
jgi:hypothetical protein